MRAVVQRVRSASVAVGAEVVGEIDAGLCVLVGVTHDDDAASAERLAGKIWQLRLFPDASGQMNVSVADVGADILIVSQFTLYGDVGRGRRPSFVAAAPGPIAEPLVEHVVSSLRNLGARVEAGRFGVDMQVSLVNDGPVTLIVEV